MTKLTVICSYCDGEAELVAGDVIYPHRSDLSHKRFWQCEPCGAYVGTHPNSARGVPLGRLANAELRKAKSAAHAKFDPLWKAKQTKTHCSKGEARNAAYRWLAGELGIEVKDCHIGMFDLDKCRRVVEICGRFRV